jgi:hypothetical protein
VTKRVFDIRVIVLLWEACNAIKYERIDIAPWALSGLLLDENIQSTAAPVACQLQTKPVRYL